MKKGLVIVGGGGHAKVVIDALRCSGNYAIYGIVDPKLSKRSSVLGVRVVGGDAILPEIFKKGVRHAFIGVGSIGNYQARKKICEELEVIGFRMPAVAHPTAVIARDVRLGAGTFVAAGAVINPGTIIGANIIVNTSSSIDHDCVIGDFVHIAPGVTLSGGVEVGAGTHIGTGANVTQCLKIGRNCFVKAGATVSRNLKDGSRCA